MIDSAWNRETLFLGVNDRTVVILGFTEVDAVMSPSKSTEPEWMMWFRLVAAGIARALCVKRGLDSGLLRVVAGIAVNRCLRC